MEGKEKLLIKSCHMIITSTFFSACQLNLILIKNVPFFQVEFLTSITKLCLLHINSTYADVASGYSKLLSILPWNITLPILAHMNFEVHSRVRLVWI